MGQRESWDKTASFGPLWREKNVPARPVCPAPSPRVPPAEGQ